MARRIAFPSNKAHQARTTDGAVTAGRCRSTGSQADRSVPDAPCADAAHAQKQESGMLNETDIANIIELILAQEGGYVDDPDDHGGETNFGITRPFLAEYGDGTSATVRDLTHAAAA